MYLGLCLICVTLMAWGVNAGRPARPTLVHRAPDRPDRSPVAGAGSLADVEDLMRAASFPAEAVGRTMARARSGGVGGRTMWRWIHAHGAARLATALDAGLSEAALLEHLDAGTDPDWAELTVLAGLANDTLPAGMPVDELIDLDVVPALEDLTFPDDLTDWATVSPDPSELRRFENLPPIAGPGLSPLRPTADWEDDGGRWPDVA